MAGLDSNYMRFRDDIARRALVVRNHHFPHFRVSLIL
jgi:hypothetical protein